MEITSEQRDAWARREENREWELLIGQHYKRPSGMIDVEALHGIARLNGLLDTHAKYDHLNVGQIAMNIRNRLRPLWKRGELKLPST